MTLYCW